MNAIRSVGGKVFGSSGEKEDDGRDKWPSRTAFVLAAIGGAVGLGNLLRFPSIVFANSGLQFFIPYFIALFFLGIPVLLLEISIGQAYRGGCIVAFDHISKRAKGLGLAVPITGYTVVTYYVTILAWIMTYFRYSFHSPLRWKGRDGQATDFFINVVIDNVDPNPGSISSSGEVTYATYPGTALVPETVGWCAFSWFVVWLCMFKGVSLTGKVIYVTMGFPICMLFVLLGRSASLPDAQEGIKYYFAEWHSEKLATGKIWTDACGQIFFSIGVGFGYFTTYASYNSKFQNSVADTLIIAFSNSAYEIIAGFAVFGVIGYLGLTPEEDGTSLSTFTVGFLTYPTALAELPGANVWCVLFFLTLMMLGVTSAIALLETMTTLVCDTDWGKKIPRVAVSTTAVIISFLLSLMYCTEFGLNLLDAVDGWTSNITLIFVVWAECVAITTIYRYKDVVGQVGWISFIIYNVSYFGAMLGGVVIAHEIMPEAGAGFAFGLWIFGSILATVLAKTPDSPAPAILARVPFLGKYLSRGLSTFKSKFWYLAFYSGNQLTRDLNVVVAANGGWRIPFFWAPVLKYISAPILSIIFGFAYPKYWSTNRTDPIYTFAFVISHCCILLVTLGLIIPRAFDVFIPYARRGEGNFGYAPNVTMGIEGPPAYDDGHRVDEENGYGEKKAAL